MVSMVAMIRSKGDFTFFVMLARLIFCQMGEDKDCGEVVIVGSTACCVVGSYWVKRLGAFVKALMFV